MKFIKKTSNLTFLLLLTVANIAHGLTPTILTKKLTIHDGPAGASVTIIDNYDNKDQKYSFYSAKALQRITLNTSLPVAGQKVGFEYESTEEYICTGTAEILEAVYNPVMIQIYPPPAVSFDKLLVKFSGQTCRWTDGLLHAAVVKILTGILEINQSGTDDQCLDNKLENSALKSDIEKLLSDNEKLLESHAALEQSVKDLRLEVKIGKEQHSIISKEKAAVDLQIKDVNKAFSKAKPNNVSSLKTLHGNLKKILNKVVAQAKK